MADNIALVYGTSEGQTKKIAEHIADQREFRGLNTDLYDGRSLPANFQPAKYDGIIVGASIHAGKFPKAINKAVRQNINVFQRERSGFFSVGLLASMEEPGEGSTTRRIVDEFLEDVGWQPGVVESFAGAIPFSQYGFFRRMIMKFILSRRTDEKIDTKQDYEYTDWSRVDEFVARCEREFAKGSEVRVGQG